MLSLVPQKPSRMSLKEFGPRLLQALKDAKVTQVDISRASDVDTGGLSAFFSGKKGLEAENLLSVLRAAAERNVDLNLVLTGRQPASRVHVVADATIAQHLEALLLSIRGQPTHEEHRASREGPASRHKPSKLKGS